jgi:hypothetical protein
MPYQRDAEAVIRDWRQVLRHISQAAAGFSCLHDEDIRMGIGRPL